MKRSFHRMLAWRPVMLRSLPARLRPHVTSGRATLILLTLVVVLASLSLEAPHTLLSVSAHSEVVEIRVVNRQASTFVLPAARVLPTDECARAVVVEPVAGSTITYARPHRQALVVTVDGAAYWTDDRMRAQQQAPAQTDFVRFEVHQGEGSPCPAGERVRLPANGVVAIGSPLNPVADDDSDQLALLSGRLMLYGRAVSRVLGIVTLDWGPFKADSLYLSQEFPLPGGASILTASGDRPDASPRDAESDARWWGFVDVSFHAGDLGAMGVEVSTNARFVELYTPAPFSRSGDDGAALPDVISLSHGARLASDPNLLWMYGLVGLLITILTLSRFFSRDGAAPP